MIYVGLLVTLISGFFFTTSVGMEKEQSFFGKEIVCFKVNFSHTYAPKADKKIDFYRIVKCDFPAQLTKDENFVTKISGDREESIRLFQLAKGGEIGFKYPIKESIKLESQSNKEVHYCVFLNEQDRVIDVLSKAELLILCSARQNRITSGVPVCFYKDDSGEKIDGFIKLWTLQGKAEFQKVVQLVHDNSEKWCKDLGNKVGNDWSTTESTNANFLRILKGELQDLIEIFKKIQDKPSIKPVVTVTPTKETTEPPSGVFRRLVLGCVIGGIIGIIACIVLFKRSR